MSADTHSGSNPAGGGGNAVPADGNAGKLFDFAEVSLSSGSLASFEVVEVEHRGDVIAVELIVL